MTIQDVLMLYIGDRESGAAIRETAELDGGYVYLPEHMMQALGMYITYLPNVIVVDSAVGYSADVLMHLQSVDAQPILLLTDEPGERRAQLDGVFRMDRDSSPDDIVEAARQLVSGGTLLRQPVSNGYRRTG